MVKNKGKLEEICVWYKSSTDLFGVMDSPNYCKERNCNGFDFTCPYYLPLSGYHTLRPLQDRQGGDHDE